MKIYGVNKNKITSPLEKEIVYYFCKKFNYKLHDNPIIKYSLSYGNIIFMYIQYESNNYLDVMFIIYKSEIETIRRNLKIDSII